MQNELEEAVNGLHLPTWSRGYIPCDKPGSEVTCAQTVQAWRTLSSWNHYMEEVPFQQRKYLLMQHRYDGVGNRFSTDTVAYVVALMLNRSLIVDGVYPVPDGVKKGQAFAFNPHVRLRVGEANETLSEIEQDQHTEWILDTFDRWYFHNFYQVDLFPILKIDLLLYATMTYVNGQLAEFCTKNFGLHASYFVCNFLMAIPEAALKEANKTVVSIPRHVRLFGVHLRFHYAHHFFSHTISQTIMAALPFLEHQKELQPTVFAFASDSLEMEQGFIHFFPDTIKTSALRKADADHDSALFDVALIEICDDCLLTYRSTFSYVCAMRKGKRAWFVEKESPGVFQASNSQATAISALYHDYDVNDWQLNRRVHITSTNEDALRYYFKYLLL